jgi:phosphoribosylanthranilate isomerase
MVRTKFCGITRHRDALLAAELGVDALGFVFAPSPRQIQPERARRIIAALPPFVRTVGVFVDEDVRTVRRIAAFCGLDMIQFHGNEPPEFCRTFMPHVIKAFQLKNEAVVGSLKAYCGTVAAFLLDAYSKEKKGGTGMPCDWNLAAQAKGLGVPVILAGGLSPSNIREAVLTVRPYAVDMNSGIEESPGKKSLRLMRAIMETIREIDCGG